MKNNQLNQFNAGGTHESSPFGGIPMGKDSKGVPNRVEQGETMKDDFVFSNRIVLTPDVIAKFNLPKTLTNKTVADATKILDKKFEGRNDKISNSTKDSMLGRMGQAQEAIKAKQAQLSAAMDVNSTEVPDMMNGETPEAFAYGGRINKFLLGGDSIDPTSNSSNILGYTAGQADEFGDLINKSGSKGPSTTGAANSSGGSGISGYYGMIGSAIGSVGTALKAGYGTPTMHDNLLTDKEKGMNSAYESVKTGVASVIPMAGLFNGVEKLGKGLGQAVGGDKGGDITQGFFDPFSNVMRKDTNFGQKLLSVADPIAAGLITNNLNQKRRAKQQIETSLAMNSQFNDNGYKYGGKMNKMADGGLLDPLNTNQPIVNLQDILGVTTDGIWGPKSRQALINWQKSKGITADGKYGPETFQTAGLDRNGNKIFRPRINAITDTEAYKNMEASTDLSNQYLLQNNTRLTNTPNINIPVDSNNSNNSNINLRPVANWLGNNYGDILRYAPIAANAYQLSQLKKPQYERLNRLSNRYTPTYVDENVMRNVVDQEYNNTTNAIQNSGGSQGAVRNSLLAAQLNKTKGLSDAYMNAAQINAGQRAVAQNFNLGVDQTNLQQSNQELDINDRNIANYDTQKSKLIGALGTDVGEIGKEETYKKMAKEMFGYSWSGKYYVDSKGNRKSKEEMESEINKSKANLSSLGGYLFKQK